jgi:apolipoprotein N-acyltransferase
MAEKSDGLIVQTNSATFSGTAESRQQLAITRIRAVENSREILSVSTIGISAFIDNNGRVVSQTDENVQSAIVGDLNLNHYQTLSNRLGYLANLYVFAIIFLLAWRRSKRREVL